MADTGSGGRGPYAAGLSSEEIRAVYGDGPVARLCSNENPLGPPAGAVEAACGALGAAHLYPPGQDAALAGAVAARHGLEPERVVLGPGSVAILELLLTVACLPEPGGWDDGPGRWAVAFEPCFPGFAARARALGVGLARVPLGDGFSMPLAALARACGPDTALVYVANPDNPSGRAVGARELAALAGDLPSEALLVVDEAYVDFADDPGEHSVLSLLGELPRVAVLRTFSKAYGLAGLRVGWAALPPDVAARARAAQAPFGITAPASAAALAALGDTAHHAASVALVREGRAFLSAELARLGCAPVPGQGSFVMFRPPRAAREVFEALLARGVVVRLLDYAGLPEHLRVSCGTMDENHRFTAALTEVLAQP